MCFKRRVSAWATKEDLITDINKNDVFVEINTRRIARCSDQALCPCYSHQYMVCVTDHRAGGQKWCMDEFILCNLCISCAICAVDIVISNFIALYLCCTCYKGCDLRPKVVKKTHPFDFRNQMVYEGTACKYWCELNKIDFVSEFDTEFGKVRIVYDKDYDAARNTPESNNNDTNESRSDRSYVAKLFIDGAEQRLVPLHNRHINNVLGNDTTDIVRQFME